jgi:hypothetical protein
MFSLLSSACSSIAGPVIFTVEPVFFTMVAMLNVSLLSIAGRVISD